MILTPGFANFVTFSRMPGTTQIPPSMSSTLRLSRHKWLGLCTQTPMWCLPPHVLQQQDHHDAEFIHIPATTPWPAFWWPPNFPDARFPWPSRTNTWTFAKTLVPEPDPSRHPPPPFCSGQFHHCDHSHPRGHHPDHNWGLHPHLRGTKIRLRSHCGNPQASSDDI